MTRTTFERSLTQHAALTLSFWPVLLIVRCYELAIVRASHPLPPGTGEAFFRGVVHDFATSLWIGVLLLPLVPLGIYALRATGMLQRVLLMLIGIAAVMLAQYFAVTFVPLGADFWGYSLKDVRDTTMASTGINIMSVLPLAAVAVIAWFSQRVLLRLIRSARAAYVIEGAALASVLAAPLLTPMPQRFSADAPYYLALNKTSYFVRGTASYVAERRMLAKSAVAFTAYPLLRPNSHEDVLGPFLERAPDKPNIVIILVEGLGRDFVGAGARYGGFTPFLDSLTQRSLYFENFMSVAGRTFGALPAVLGSLPFGGTGFMELGARMPRHIGLVNVLREQGYVTSYFTGTDGHFDNIDVFMDREGVERFVDASRFGPGYEKEPPSESGFSWGYGDAELFRRSFAEIGNTDRRPRLDVYLTITSHEPFIPPNREQYDARFTQRLTALNPPNRSEIDAYRNVFSSLLYVDDALRGFFAEYAKRADYGRTVFLITGDHRLIPIPQAGRADRYHVPLLVFSPLLKAPAKFASVSSHNDITPTLLAYLEQNYGVTLPEKVSWLGSVIDTARQFRSTHSVGLMRVKGQLDEYLDGDTFLSGDQAFRLGEGFTLTTGVVDTARTAAIRKRAYFAQLNRFLTSGDHIYPGGVGDTTSAQEAREQDSVFAALGLEKKTPTDAFMAARDLAFAHKYPPARLILRKQLREIPNFHDARALLGRTYGWEGQYDIGRAILNELGRRAPLYPDGYVARVDMEIWSGRYDNALRVADSAIVRFPAIGDVHLARAKALEQLGRKAEALVELDKIRAKDPAESLAAVLRVRLKQ